MATPYKLIAAGAAGGDATVVCSVAANLRSISITNSATAIRRVKIYDKATAPASTDTPKQVYEIPAAAASSIAGSNIHIPVTGLAFTAGIGLRIVTGQADNDNNAATAGDVVVNLSYDALG